MENYTAKMGGMITMKDVLALYSNQRPFVRIFVEFRHRLSPLEVLEAFVPKKGNILDLGCGHGLFANYMALRSQYREVIGIDPSISKIEIAKRTESRVSNVHYFVSEVDAVWERGPFDAITIVDVLYLLPQVKQKKILRTCYQLLKPSGILILKTQDTRPLWRFVWTYIQEMLIVRFLRLTLGDKKLHFLSARKTKQFLEEVGFIAIQYHKLPTRIFYPNIVFVCGKEEHGSFLPTA